MPSPTATDRYWSGVLDDFRRSGLTHAEFCRRRGLSLHTFRKRLYHRPVPSPTPPRFLPVTLPPQSRGDSAPAADPLVLILPGQRRLAVGPSFDPHTLRRLIAALEARP